jgi:hypothetical protein
MVVLNAGERGISAAFYSTNGRGRGAKVSPAERRPVAVTTARRYVMAIMSYPASGPLCSFCQRPSAEVLSLVDGGTVRICSNCVADCVAVIGAEHPEWLAELIAALTREP